MPIIERHIRIAAPRERVWDVLVDVAGQPRWMRDLKEVRVDTPGPLRVGSRAVGRLRIFGLTQLDPVEITVLDPPAHYAIAHLGGFRGRGEFELRSMDAGRSTHIRWRESLTPTAAAFPLVTRIGALPLVGPVVVAAAGGVAELSDPLLGPLLELVFRADLRRLKRLLETGRI